MSVATKLAAVDAQALPLRRFRSRRFWIVSALVALGAAVVTVLLAGYVWLESYAPLEQGSSWRGVIGAEGVTASPLAASGGVTVAFPLYRPQGRFHVRISVANRGRLGVTVLGVPEASRYWTEPANGTMAVSDTVTFRIRYARWFERSQTVRMLLAVVLVCARGVQPAPGR